MNENDTTATPAPEKIYVWVAFNSVTGEGHSSPVTIATTAERAMQAVDARCFPHKDHEWAQDAVTGDWSRPFPEPWMDGDWYVERMELLA